MKLQQFHLLDKKLFRSPLLDELVYIVIPIVNFLDGKSQRQQKFCSEILFLPLNILFYGSKCPNLI